MKWLEDLTLKFKSGNNIEIERATILRSEWDAIIEEIKILRELLWLRHGCNNLYGDDGERQCGSCGLDFKRDSAQKISDRFEEIGRKTLEKHFKTNSHGLPYIDDVPEMPPVKLPRKDYHQCGDHQVDVSGCDIYCPVCRKGWRR